MRAVRWGEGEGGPYEPAAADVPRQVDRLDEGVGVHKDAACDRHGAYTVAVAPGGAARREEVESLHHRGRIVGAEDGPARHPKQRYRLGDRGQVSTAPTGGTAGGDTPASDGASPISPP